MKRILFKISSNPKIVKFLVYLEYIFLFLYTFSLPSFSARFPLNIISYFLMALLITNTFLLILIKKCFKFNKHFLIIPAFIVWLFIGTLFFSHNYRGVLTLFLLGITMFVFYLAFKVINNFKYCFYTLLFAVLAFSLYFLVIYWEPILNFKSYTNGSFRLGSYFDNVNHIGTYFFLGFALAFFFLLFGSRKEKLLSLLGILFLFLGMTTGSREFVINIILITVIMLFFKFRKKKYIFFLSLFLAVALIIFLINLPFMATMKMRFEKMIIALLGGGGEGSTTTRFTWQLFGLVLGSQNIIPGYGFYGFSVASGTGTYSHANYSEIICNGGLVGFLLFYGYMMYIFCKTSCWNNSYKSFAAALSLTFIVSSPVSIFYSSKETYLFFGLMLSIMDVSFNNQTLWRKKGESTGDGSMSCVVKI